MKIIKKAFYFSFFLTILLILFGSIELIIKSVLFSFFILFIIISIIYFLLNKIGVDL